MIEQCITSLAILKVNWDSRGSGYIDNFIPFVSEIMQNSSTDEMTLAEIHNSAMQQFGMKIPQGALQTILNRTYRLGYIVRRKNIYRRTDKLNMLPNTKKLREKALKQYESLIERFINFSKKKYNTNINNEQAESIIFSYLKEHSVPILSISVKENIFQYQEMKVKNCDFLIKSFIIYLYENDHEGFTFLESAVKGFMLSNALYYSDISNLNQKFKGLQVFLDTRFIIRLFGWSGKQLQIIPEELFENLSDEKVNFAIFDNTLQEIYGVLSATANAIRTPSNLKQAYGETVEYCLNANKKSSDIELIISQLPELISKRNIQIIERPKHAIPLSIDETKLEEILQNMVQYKKKEALIHDLDALTSIHRLRCGQIVKNLESSRYLFITTNSSLVNACIKYFRNEYDENTVPLCVLDSVLATLMWIKKPIQSPDLPKKQVISDCYAALNPSDTLWKLYLEEINSLYKRGDITENDYNLLRYSIEARTALMETVMGSQDAFVEETVFEVLEKAKNAVKSDIELELQNEKRKSQSTEERFEEKQKEVRLVSFERYNDLDRIKSALDKKATQKINRNLKLSLAIVAVLIISIIFLIFKIGWNKMEPWTFILSLIPPLFYYSYFAITQCEFSPINLYNRKIEEMKLKNYIEFNFDLRLYEKLKNEI